MKRVDYEIMPHDVWPRLASRLPLPLSREEAEIDLRWLAAERMIYGRVFPSRPELVARWGADGVGGWTDKRVRGLLASDWQDETQGWTVDELRAPTRKGKRADKGPTKGRQGADEGPTANGSTGTTAAERADKGPTKGRQGADEGPHARSDQPHPQPQPIGVSGNARTPDVAPVRPPPESPNRELALALGTRPDLLRLLLAPLDPADPAIRDLDELRRVPLEELQYRRGMGSKRAQQLAALLAEAGVPMVAEKPAVAATGPPTRASPANDRRKRLLDALATARQNLAAGATDALP
jgi:hypothetical protein